MKISDEVKSFLKEQNSCLTDLADNENQIENIIQILIKARDSNKQIFTIGNGGSGSTASHFVSDLLKTALVKSKKRFKAISLVDNVPVLLAWSNDKDYESIFEEQLKNFLSTKDIIIAFSGSGNSKNILNALKFAKNNNAICIGFTGETGGKMEKNCDVCLKIPSNDMLTIESQHVIICHCIIKAIRSLGTPIFKYE
jgi:D-sedoheptulose 7-phosphate isomerase